MHVSLSSVLGPSAPTDRADVSFVRDCRDIGMVQSLAAVAVEKFPTDIATLAPEQGALRDRPREPGYFVDFGERLGDELLDTTFAHGILLITKRR